MQDSGFWPSWRWRPLHRFVYRREPTVSLHFRHRPQLLRAASTEWVSHQRLVQRLQRWTSSWPAEPHFLRKEFSAIPFWQLPRHERSELFRWVDSGTELHHSPCAVARGSLRSSVWRCFFFLFSLAYQRQPHWRGRCRTCPYYYHAETKALHNISTEEKGYPFAPSLGPLLRKSQNNLEISENFALSSGAGIYSKRSDNRCFRAASEYKQGLRVLSGKCWMLDVCSKPSEIPYVQSISRFRQNCAC